MRRRALLLWTLAASLLPVHPVFAKSKSKSAPVQERPGMAYIPAGTFKMGSAPDDPVAFDFEKPKEQPQHDVWVDAYYIDRYEVTNEQFRKYNPEHVVDSRSSCATCPATRLMWREASEYCAAQKPPKRLPTEAEWEKAAKGGGTQRLEPVDEYAWFLPNADGHTHPVGQKKPNGYGLYDVLGNAREWTADWFDADYYKRSSENAKNPKGPPSGERKVERGGAFFMFRRSVTETIRYNHPPTFRLYFLGFRCAQDP